VPRSPPLLTATTGLAATLPSAARFWARLEKVPANLPDHSLLDKNETHTGRAAPRKFRIPADEIYLTTAYRRSSPARYSAPFFDGYNTHRKDGSAGSRRLPIWDTQRGMNPRPAGSIVGCNRDEIALLRNATEATATSRTA